MADIIEVQKAIFEEINNPHNRIHIKVQKKELDRDQYLKETKQKCLKAGLSEEDAADIVLLVDKSLWGFGIIDELISDPDISDIRLINENTVRIKRLGKRLPTPIKFASKDEYERYIEFITNRNNTNISVTNAAQVFTDKDTCATDILRFSLVSDLINTGDRSTLLIRKIPKQKKTFENLISAKYCTPAQADYLKKRWEDGYGILICGPNGSGKTTLANALLDSTPKDKSAVVIQESEELFCDSHPEMIFRKVVPPRTGSQVSYGLKDLARLALMESFDIIVVGEIKGDEAAELSYATYTGSQAMTTVHANSAAEGYEKLIDYGLDAQPNRSRDHFAKQLKSLNTVVFVSDYKIREILELDGWDKKLGEYRFKDAGVTSEENGEP
jgi:pilus assembly protein CpaF